MHQFDDVAIQSEAACMSADDPLDCYLAQSVMGSARVRHGGLLCERTERDAESCFSERDNQDEVMLAGTPLPKRRDFLAGAEVS